MVCNMRWLCVFYITRNPNCLAKKNHWNIYWNTIRTSHFLLFLPNIFVIFWWFFKMERRSHILTHFSRIYREDVRNLILGYPSLKNKNFGTFLGEIHRINPEILGYPRIPGYPLTTSLVRSKFWDYSETRRPTSFTYYREVGSPCLVKL